MLAHPPPGPFLQDSDDLMARGKGQLHPPPVAPSPPEERLLVWVKDRNPSRWSPTVKYTTTSSREIDALFLKPDYQEWKKLFSALKITFASDPTAFDVVGLLSELKGAAIALQTAGRLTPEAAQTIEYLANQALLQLFSGCWGFSKEPVAPDVMRRLRGIAQGVGQSSSRLGVSSDDFNTRVVAVVGEARRRETPASRGHSLAVLVCLAEGYTAGEPSKVYEILRLQRALLVSGGAVSTNIDAFLTRAGYYPGRSLTVDDLCATAHYRSPSLDIAAAKKAALTTYLATIDLDSPGITDHLEDLKLWAAILAAQPPANTCSPEAIKTRLLDKLDCLSDEDRKVLARILFESLKHYDFGRKNDPYYENALEDKGVLRWVAFDTKAKDKADKGDINIKTLDDNTYALLMQYLQKINDLNKITMENQHFIKSAGMNYYDYRYGSSKYWAQPLAVRQDIDRLGALRRQDSFSRAEIVELDAIFARLRAAGVIKDSKANEIITWEERSWLIERASLSGMAVPDYGSVIVGIADPNYSTVLVDGNVVVGPASRAIHYLAVTGRLDQSLVFPCLLMFHVGLLD
jgi:hypothetical protein